MSLLFVPILHKTLHTDRPQQPNVGNTPQSHGPTIAQSNPAVLKSPIAQTYQIGYATPALESSRTIGSATVHPRDTIPHPFQSNSNNATFSPPFDATFPPPKLPALPLSTSTVHPLRVNRVSVPFLWCLSHTTCHQFPAPDQTRTRAHRPIADCNGQTDTRDTVMPSRVHGPEIYQRLR